MQEKNKTPGTSGVEQVYANHMEAFARNMVRLFDQGPRLSPRWPSGPARTGKVPTAWPRKLAKRPSHWARSRGIGWPSLPNSPPRRASCWRATPISGAASVRRFLGEEVEPVVEPEPGDNRFKDPDWSNGQVFDFWKQAYLITSRWAEDLTRNTRGVDERRARRRCSI